MKTLAITLIIIFIASSCQKHEKHDILHYFDSYTYENRLELRNARIFKLLPKEEGVMEVTVEGLSGSKWFYEDFLEKQDSSKGVYRKVDEDFSLCYRFDSVGVAQYNNFSNGSMFFYPNVTLSAKKAYTIKGKEHLVYVYAENEGSNGIISYYLEEFGFFAYDLNNGSFLICKRASEYNDKINREALRGVCDSLIRDTCFFSIYRFNEKNPCLQKILRNIN